MDFIINLLAFVFSLGLIIAIHELGHLIFAKKANILCFEYSIGMGPAIYKKKGKETVFAVRAIPIGGFVSMAGEAVSTEMVKEDQTVGLNFKDGKIKEIILDKSLEREKTMRVSDFEIYDEHKTGLFLEGYVEGQLERYDILEDAFYKISVKQELQIAPYDRCFESKKYVPKLLTLIAGPAMNFLLALLLFLIVAAFTGKPQNTNVVGSLVNGSPAQIEQINVGDKIVSLNGITITNWTSIGDLINDLDSVEAVIVGVERKESGTVENITLDLRVDINQLGISNFTEQGAKTGNSGAIIGTSFGKTIDILQTNDVITSVVYNEITYPINNWDNLLDIMPLLKGGSLRVDFLREGEPKTEFIQVWEHKVLNSQGVQAYQVLIGVSPEYGFDFIHMITYPFTATGNSFMQVIQVLGLLFGGSEQIGVNDLSGPVGIFNIVGMYVQAGFIALLGFIAFLSVNIGIMNLLPIPALDGGRILFISIEAITKKRIPRNVDNIVNNIFFILLMVLFVYITFNDVLRLF